jgi:diguanylate cyclase (GGDEF)-like protein
MTAVPAAQESLYASERTEVFRARLPDGTAVVCKRPLGSGASRRLRHEGAVMSRLAGVAGVPGVVPDSDAVGMIILWDAGGVALAQRLSDGPLPAESLVEVAVRLAAVVAEVHRRGVIHKDINPANVLYGADGEVHLIDFDLATTSAEERPGFGHQSQIAGTPAYLAPEQTGRTGWPVDKRADLYGVGATLYELATGQPPFGRGDLARLVHDHLARLPVSPTEVNPAVPEGLARIILRLLEKEPDRRYQSADGLLHDLVRLRAGLARGDGGVFPLGERDFPVRLTPPSRLVGRDAEVEALRTALRQAIAGHCRGLLVTGAPGIGKTALIDELRASVTAAGGWFVTGKFDQYRQDGDSDAVSQALTGLGRLLLAEPAAALAEHRQRLRAALGDNAALMAAMSPGFASVLDVAPLDPAAMAAVDEKRLIQAGLEVVRAAAGPARPLVMVLDDLQWAAATPIGFVDALLTDTELAGLLLVGAYRDREVDAVHPLSANLVRWERLGVAVAVLHLRNLPAAELTTLLGGMLRLPVAAATALAAEIGPRTGGNPFDTVELINALRDEGVLVAGADGWHWDVAGVRQHVGGGDVLDLLAARIARLPGHTQALLEATACLGGGIGHDLLGVATGEPAERVAEALAPALEDGLLVVDGAQQDAIRFRHDRIQQAAHHRSDPADRRRLQLGLARRLAERPNLAGLAAEQYRAAVEAVTEPGERRRAAALMHATARAARLLNPGVAEDLLAAGAALLAPVARAEDAALLLAFDIDRHAALCGLGRLEEADEVYRAVELRCPQPLELAGAAGEQIFSLSNRNRQADAVALGFDLVRRLGVEVPGEAELPAATERGLDAFQRWATEDGGVAADLARPAVSDPRVLALAEVIQRLMPAVFFSGHPAFAWLMCEAQRLWAEAGPLPALAAPISGAYYPMNRLRGDFRVGYLAARRVVEFCEARGYQPAGAQAGVLYVMSGAPWFEPVETVAEQAARIRETLQRCGDAQTACMMYGALLALTLDCAPELDAVEAEAATGMATAVRIGSDHTYSSLVAWRQLVRAMRGETDLPGGFGDSTVDEDELFTTPAANPVAQAQACTVRALAAALFDDPQRLSAYAEQAFAQRPYNPVVYHLVLIHSLRALALARRAQSAPEERAGLLDGIDEHLTWLAARAADAPSNFLPLLRLIEAERAWATGDGLAAAQAFDAALREVRPRCRPWQRALITERAARCHLAFGMEQVGRSLLGEARSCYAAWGATGKVAQLDRQDPGLRPEAWRLHEARTTGATTTMSSDVIDLVAVLAAARALSSETSLDQLRDRVVEILRAMTGATDIQVALWDAEVAGWMLDGDRPIEAADAGTAPLSAFRYAERTREPLVVDDATRDDRFATDPFLIGLVSCSLLVVPILSQGRPRAMLMMENRLTSGAFTADRLDAVLLIAGQLAVCVDNALLYASLERKVAERTRDLAAARDQLELLSLTDQLTGLPNRRRLDEGLHSAWEYAERTGNPIGVAMVDIDQFKLYNDHYGHLGGDSCLSLIGKTMAAVVRGYDLVARYGGEEFCIVLPDTDANTATVVAERVRAAVFALAEPHVEASHSVVTVSIGVAALIPTVDSRPDHLVETADAALYTAKRDGRNRVATA